jgi:CyaY protein
MTEPMDERAFDTAADRALYALEAALNEIDGIEADLESGILTIEFPDGVRYVINSHRAARQIWMAAGARAWHFDVDPRTDRWTATKTGEELRACVEEQVSAKLGRSVRLRG